MHEAGGWWGGGPTAQVNRAMQHSSSEAGVDLRADVSLAKLSFLGGKHRM